MYAGMYADCIHSYTYFMTGAAKYPYWPLVSKLDWRAHLGYRDIGIACFSESSWWCFVKFI